MELTYLVRGADGKEYGPASLADLTAWITEGRVPAEQEVQRSDMQSWAAAGAFTELQPAFESLPSSPSRGPQPRGVATSRATSGTGVAASNKVAALAQMKAGGSWFYWVAGLSLVNSFSALSGNDWRFILGLGITQVFDLFGANAGGGGKIIALVLDLLAAGVLVGFGVFANKGHGWAFIIGMLLIALDGLILLLRREWIGVAFHVFVIYCLFRGFSASRQLRGI